MKLVASTKELAELWRKQYPDVEVVMSQPLPTATRGIIELRENRSARRAAAKGVEK